MKTSTVVYSAPIPVGHRVEVTWYGESSCKLFGGSKTTVREYEPIIRDLDTGVEYASDFVYGTGSSKKPDTPLEVSAEVQAEEIESVRGRVVACRVVTLRGFSDYDVQTELTIEPEG